MSKVAPSSFLYPFSYVSNFGFLSRFLFEMRFGWLSDIFVSTVFSRKPLDFSDGFQKNSKFGSYVIGLVLYRFQKFLFFLFNLIFFDLKILWYLRAATFAFCVLSTISSLVFICVSIILHYLNLSYQIFQFLLCSFCV